MAIEKFSNAWYDAHGNYLQTNYLWNTFNIIGPPDSDGLKVYMTDLSNAGLSGYIHGAVDHHLDTEGANATYPSVGQLAQLVFSDDAGSTAVVTIPAPIQAMFLPDAITVNSAQTDVALLITYALGSNRLYTAAGTQCTSYVRGFRTGRGAP